MIKTRTLQSLIEDHVHFRPTANGWISGKCQVCNDYKERAGFKFDDGKVYMNCWNCGAGAVYEEFSGHISRKMRNYLNAYGIDDSEISNVVNTAFFKKEEESNSVITLDKLTKVDTSTQTISLPKNSVELGKDESNIEYQLKLVKYLTNRKVDLSKYKFYFSLEERFINRIIIPFYRGNNLIYWQARSIIKTEKKRYDNCPAKRDAVMFNMNKLNIYSHAPLFITEGVFDSMMIDGVCCLGSKLSDAKIELLKRSPRRKIFVIDKDDNGRQLAETVLKQGWEITFSPDGTEDVNDSVCRFGLIWTAEQLMKNIRSTPDSAKLAINLNCK